MQNLKNRFIYRCFHVWAIASACTAATLFFPNLALAESSPAWGGLGFAPRLRGSYNISLDELALGTGLIVRIHPDLSPQSRVPFEIQLEFGYDRYLEIDRYDLSNVASFHYFIGKWRFRPSIFGSIGRVFTQHGDAHAIRWHFGAGAGVGYHFRRLQIGMNARIEALVGGKTSPFIPRTDAIVDVQLLGIFYAF